MKLTLLLIPLILLSSCTIDWNDEKDKKIAELEKQITELKEKNDDELFKKKQECSKYTEKLKAEAEKETEDMTKALIDTIYYKELKEIFYSKNKNSCFAVNEITLENFERNDSWNITREVDYSKNTKMVIVDILTNDATNYNIPEQENEYNLMLWELKWENK